MHLLFDPHSQRLRLIEVYDLSRMQVRCCMQMQCAHCSVLACRLALYCSLDQGPALRSAGAAPVQVRCGVSLVGGASKPATVARIYDLCGPTYPGQLDEALHTYVVQYPGVLFLFPAPAGQAAPQEMPPELPGGGAPTADRICIFAGSAGVPLSQIIIQRGFSLSVDADAAARSCSICKFSTLVAGLAATLIAGCGMSPCPASSSTCSEACLCVQAAWQAWPACQLRDQGRVTRSASLWMPIWARALFSGAPGPVCRARHPDWEQGTQIGSREPAVPRSSTWPCAAGGMPTSGAAVWLAGRSGGCCVRLDRTALCRHGAAAVSFGDSPQDVWAQLGAPSGAALRGSSPLGGQLGAAPDFFYSYCDR